LSYERRRKKNPPPPQAQQLGDCIHQYEGNTPEIQEYGQRADMYYNSTSQAEATLSRYSNVGGLANETQNTPT